MNIHFASLLSPGPLRLALAGALSVGALGCQSVAPAPALGVRSDGSFDRLTLRSSGGLPGPTNPRDECADVTSLEVDGPGLTVAWSRCDYSPAVGHTVSVTGKRAITSVELAGVEAGLQQISVGHSGECGADAPVVRLDVQTGSTHTQFIDDFYSCVPAPEGSSYVTNIDVVWAPVAALVPR